MAPVRATTAPRALLLLALVCALAGCVHGRALKQIITPTLNPFTGPRVTTVTPTLFGPQVTSTVARPTLNPFRGPVYTTTTLGPGGSSVSRYSNGFLGPIGVTLGK